MTIKLTKPQWKVMDDLLIHGPRKNGGWIQIPVRNLKRLGFLTEDENGLLTVTELGCKFVHDEAFGKLVKHVGINGGIRP